jgi:hypothetical protein
MIEKIIYDGRIDGTSKAIQEIVDLYLLENLYLPGIDFRVETENQKQLWVIYPPTENSQPKEKIINGYVEINSLTISDTEAVNLRIISCRHELNLLFFQLSQRIQAKFIVKGYPPEILTTPWRELITKGYISPLTNDENDLLLMKDVDPKKRVGKYGTDRDLTTEQVINIVSICRDYQARGGTIGSYYNDVLQPSVRDKFSLETLKGWLKRKKFSLSKKKTHP